MTPVGIAVPVTDSDALVDAVGEASRVTHNTGIAIAAAAAAVSTGVAGAASPTPRMRPSVPLPQERAGAAGGRAAMSVPGSLGRGRVRGMGRVALADALADVVGTPVAAQG